MNSDAMTEMETEECQGECSVYDKQLRRTNGVLLYRRVAHVLADQKILSFYT